MTISQRQGQTPRCAADGNYILAFAWEDLQISEQQWYWDGATRDNIDQIMREEA